MNLSSVVKGILLVLILLGLMACVLPSTAPLVRLGGGGFLSWFLIGHNVERARSDHVASAF
ncbi:hypothetical protein GV819_14620 [Pseudomonas sp. Fl5BN2]|uniref:hypothetical protein n=1 Tax=unclassified Pseudomonas TaxID=196821 RepID=UPI001378DC04|nr:MULTISPECIES: hypothetical protein [unclassified Pseudomonas]NBF03525.1 hypothetical protein [Pseudomonas sp. Fl5BN2]NBF11056.1 hypothetical protein [Pseudomonas sp. Fl4BN1]